MAFVTGFSGAMMPGPMLALVIGQTSVQGLRAVLAIVLGHALLELVTVALLMSGLRSLLLRAQVRGLIGLVGGAVLIYMGIDMVRQAATLTLNLPAHQSAVSWPGLVLAGAAVCALNPYFIGWWATVGVGGIAHVGSARATDYLTFYLGHELSDFVWYGAVGLVLVTGRAFLSDSVYQALVLVCGLIILLLAAWFVYTGARFTLGKGRAAAG